MSLSVEELLKIEDLPAFLRTEHCYNDLQHAMLVILFRHGLTALSEDNQVYTGKIIDSVTLYLYIHFLNEEEGMGFNMARDLIVREDLEVHSEMHVKFLDFWKNHVLKPFKNKDATAHQTITAMADFYNRLITHIDETDKPTYGAQALTEQQVRTELARVSKTNMPMSPFMAGAFDTVKILDPETAASLDQARMSPVALQPMGDLNLVKNVGRVLTGGHGSLRDRFAEQTRGDMSASHGANKLYVVA